jgi:hypothetical protein
MRLRYDQFHVGVDHGLAGTVAALLGIAQRLAQQPCVFRRQITHRHTERSRLACLVRAAVGQHVLQRRLVLFDLFRLQFMHHRRRAVVRCRGVRLSALTRGARAILLGRGLSGAGRCAVGRRGVHM